MRETTEHRLIAVAALVALAIAAFNVEWDYKTETPPFWEQEQPTCKALLPECGYIEVTPLDPIERN